MSIVRRMGVTAGDWVAVAVLLVVPGLLFWQGIISPPDFVRQDAASFFQPYYTFASDEVAAGRLPLWNPYTLMGIPYHAGLQSSLFYPLRWPLFGMNFITGYFVLAWSHYFLGALAAYLLMRVALRVGWLAGLLGAMAIGYGGFAQGHLSHVTYFISYPWFISTILFIWLAIQRRRWAWSLAAGGCIGLLGLVGAVHLILILLVLFATYVAYHTIVEIVILARGRGDWRSVFRPGIAVGVAFALGALIGAVQLLPAQVLIKRSTRQDASWKYITASCAHPVRNSVQLVAPFYRGNHRLGYWDEYNYHDQTHYVGVLMLLAAIVGIVTLGRERHLWFLVVLAAVGVLIGAGKYLPFYRWLYDWVPGFGQLRNPTRIFWCTEIALACLAAVGIQRVLVQPALAAWRRKLVLSVAVAGSVLALVVLAGALIQLNRYADDPAPLIEWVDSQHANNIYKPPYMAAATDVPRRIMREWDPPAWGNITAALAAIVLLPVLIWRGRGIGPLAGAVLAVVLIGDLFALSFGTIQYHKLHVALTDVPARARWLQDNLGDQRFCVIKRPALGQAEQDQVIGNRPMQFRLKSAHGSPGGILDSPERAGFCRMAQQQPKLAAAVGIRYVLVERGMRQPPWPRVHEDDRYIYYETPNCLPLVRFARRLIQVKERRQAVGVMLSPEFDPAEMAVVTDRPPAETGASKAGQLEVARADSVPGHWEIETRSDAPAQLVVHEGYDPGWRCRIDGVVASLLRTNVEFMSVAVPAGEHTVTLAYAPSEFRVGAVVSVLGLVLTAGLGFGDRWWRGRVGRSRASAARPERADQARPASPRAGKRRRRR